MWRAWCLCLSAVRPLTRRCGRALASGRRRWRSSRRSGSRRRFAAPRRSQQAQAYGTLRLMRCHVFLTSLTLSCPAQRLCGGGASERAAVPRAPVASRRGRRFRRRTDDARSQDSAAPGRRRRRRRAAAGRRQPQLRARGWIPEGDGHRKAAPPLRTLRILCGERQGVRPSRRADGGLRGRWRRARRLGGAGRRRRSAARAVR
jgi:hypothetical protein